MNIYETDRTQADVVLTLLKRLIDDCDSETANCEFQKDFYENGREHGYALTLTYVDGYYMFDKDKQIWIAFSEDRKSDNTVVYTDKGSWSGKITEKSYNEAKYFSFSDFYACAQYIKDLMKQAILNAKAKEVEV